MSIGILYTDQTVLLTGKYRLKKICMVPPSYLLNIFNNPNGFNDKALVEYVKSNINEIREKAGLGQIVVINKPKEVGFICDKATFHTKKLANQALRKIISINDGKEKPVRSYECDECSQWHLTSVPYEVWKETKKRTKTPP